jgi:hypothetical protein
LFLIHWNEKYGVVARNAQRSHNPSFQVKITCAGRLQPKFLQHPIATVSSVANKLSSIMDDSIADRKLCFCISRGSFVHCKRLSNIKKNNMGVSASSTLLFGHGDAGAKDAALGVLNPYFAGDKFVRIRNRTIHGEEWIRMKAKDLKIRYVVCYRPNAKLPMVAHAVFVSEAAVGSHLPNDRGEIMIDLDNIQIQRPTDATSKIDAGKGSEWVFANEWIMPGEARPLLPNITPSWYLPETDPRRDAMLLVSDDSSQTVINGCRKRTAMVTSIVGCRAASPIFDAKVA